jgi:hypothetical protein
VYVRWTRDGALSPIENRVSEGGGTRVIETGWLPKASPSGFWPESTGPAKTTIIGDDD